MASDERKNLLRLIDIDVRFGATHALNKVSLSLAAGECLALAGENGAGKSTIVKIITGAYPHGLYKGALEIDNEIVRFRDPVDAETRGIAVVQQELTILPTLTVAENLMVGREPTVAGVVRQHELEDRAKQILDAIGLDLPLDAMAGTLSVAQQQMIEIARAVSREARLLILDEPTSSLSGAESDALFAQIDGLRRQGVSIVYISHRLDEIKRIADRVVVLRDGSLVLDEEIGRASREVIVRAMLGDRHDAGTQPLPLAKMRDSAPVLELKNWTVPRTRPSDPFIESMDFLIRKGEIAAIYGAVGSGRSELLMSLYGSRTGLGEMILDGERAKIDSAHKAVKEGIAFVSEDRKSLGIQPWMSAAGNISLSVLDRISRLGVPVSGVETKFSNSQADAVGLSRAMVELNIRGLSGGNQQKAMLARALATGPRLLLLDEPTRGVDVGAKADIQATLLELAAQGLAIIWVSSEAEEVLEIAHSIYVMRDGELVARFAAGETSVPELVATASSMDDSLVDVNIKDRD